MSAVVIEIDWQRAGSPVRFAFVIALALTIHLAMMLWWQIRQEPDFTAAEPMNVRLVPTPAIKSPLEIPVQQPAPREPEIVQPELLEAPLVGAVEPAPELPAVMLPESESEPGPGPIAAPLPDTAQLLSTLRKYRLTDDKLYVAEPENPRIRVLGEPAPGDVMLALQDHLPDLPFGASGLDVAFYSSGFRGDLQRFGDAITQEFGFQTRYGTRVKCVVMVVMLACGWD